MKPMKQQKTFSISITRQFCIIMSAFLILTLGLILYGAFSYTRFHRDQQKSGLQAYAGQLARHTQTAYESYENICYDISYSSVVRDFLSDCENAAAYGHYTQLKSQLNQLARLNPYITDIAVYGTDGVFASLSGSQTTYRTFYEAMTDFHFPCHAVDTAPVGEKICHILTVPVFSPNAETDRCLGVVFLAVDLEQLLSDNPDFQHSFGLFTVLTDENGRLVYGDASLYETLPSARKEGDFLRMTDAGDSSLRYLCLPYDITTVNCRLYIFMEEGRAFYPIGQLSVISLMETALIIILALLLLFLFYRPLLSSLRQLTDHMKSFASGDRRILKDPVCLNHGLISYKEIDEISLAFREMLDEINHLSHTIFDTNTRMYELESINRRTEIEFLRSQAIPHILHNTLTMICGMAAEGMTDNIISVTSALAQVFRYSIKGSDLVTLREEMEIVKAYLTIQKERFGERFSVRYTFLDDSDDCLIPRMIIQPLVENAIVHGIEPALHPCELVIGAGHNPEHGYLAIWVYDNGVGMPKENLEQLRSELAAVPEPAAGEEDSLAQKHRSDNRRSIGLKNVNARMILYYGPEYTLLIDSEENAGTNVQLRVPHLTKQEEPYVPGDNN